MRKDTKLPETRKGKWIWLPRQQKDPDARHVRFRQDFTVFDMPSLAELWIATHLHFQLFINGRVCCAGPIPHPGKPRTVNVMQVDITPLLEVGTNRLAIIVHDQKTPIAGMHKTFDGLWVQINVDNRIVLSSDPFWLCSNDHGYTDTALLNAPSQFFTEEYSFQRCNRSWKTDEISRLQKDMRSGWTAPTVIADVEEGPRLVQLEQLVRMAENIQSPNIKMMGSFSQSCALSAVSFEDIILKQNTPLGNYVAETYVYAPKDETLSGFFLCDNPFALYVNNEKVLEQAVPPPPVQSALRDLRIEKLSAHERISPEFTAHLSEGWNRIFLVHHSLAPRAGAVMLFPEISADSLMTRQAPTSNAPLGWRIAGPVVTPMALLYPQAPLGELKFLSVEKRLAQANDIAGWYLSCQFKKTANDAPIQYPQFLENHHFATIDFGQTYYAYPRVFLSGHAGDVIDIVAGEHLGDGEVISYKLDGQRNVSTFILQEGSNEWLAAVQRGVRYVMVVARNVRAPVKLQGVALWQESELSDQSVKFMCSKERYNAIWEASMRTLSASMLRIYLDSPTKDCAQTLPDALIQARASFYAQGAYSISQQSLVAFADTQFETGDLNALNPSSLYQSLPDISLSLPTWVNYHYFHTGDDAFLAEMMPHILRLLDHFDHLAVEPDGPLGDLSHLYGAPCFLDHGDIDRGGICTGLNAIYCRALLDSSWLAAQNRQPDVAQALRNRASAIASKVWALTWNPERNLFADSFHDGAPSLRHSWQTSVLAIYGGIARPEHYEAIWNTLFLDEAPYERFAAGEYNNPFFKYFILEAAFAIGKRAWGLKLLEHYWGKMLDAGAVTWWEMFDPDNASLVQRNCSHCQGYSVSPNIYLITELVGIRPAEPGMNMVYFNPQAGEVTWAKATVPTPHGSIQVAWELKGDGIFEATINANYPVSVVPVLSPDVAETATINVNDKVTILAQEE